MTIGRLLSLFVILTFSTTLLAQTPPEWKPVESALARTGKLQPDGAFKFAMPRKDLKVTVAGTAIKPGLALGSWCAFSSSGDNSMVMGDLVLLEDEVAPVMAKLQAGGIEITALHDHVLQESPRVMYMHVARHGTAANLAQAIHDALATTGTPAETPAAASTQKLDLDTDKIDQALAARAKTMAASISSALRVPRLSATMGWKCPLPWEFPLPSTFSRPETAKPQSPATLF
jgi:hypothetical protein